MPITKKQHEIVKYIQKYQTKHGLSPTLAEIGDSLGITRMTVHEHIGKLEKKGMLKRVRDVSRGISLVEESGASRAGRTTLPLLGYIAAGRPIEVVEDAEEFSVEEMIPAGECYVLRVKGDSMIEDGIHDGDFVIVRKASTAQNSQIVVAVLPDEEATLKRFYREVGRIRLQPANAAMEPIYAQRVQIRGIVLGLYRKM